MKDDKEIDHIIQRALAALEDSNFLLENNRFEIAVNRLYYSIFYVLSGLALKYNFNTKSHIQLLGWFNKTFISNNTIDKKYGKFVHKIFDLRTKADYDYYSHFEKEQVKQMYKEVKSFIDVIITFIQTDG